MWFTSLWDKIMFHVTWVKLFYWYWFVLLINFLLYLFSRHFNTFLFSAVLIYYLNAVHNDHVMLKSSVVYCLLTCMLSFFSLYTHLRYNRLVYVHIVSISLTGLTKHFFRQYFVLNSIQLNTPALLSTSPVNKPFSRKNTCDHSWAKTGRIWNGSCAPYVSVKVGSVLRP